MVLFSFKFDALTWGISFKQLKHVVRGLDMLNKNEEARSRDPFGLLDVQPNSKSFILGDPGAVGAGKRLNGRGKKSGEEKSRKKARASGILLLTDHLKSLPVIGHKNIFCAQSESSSFRVTFVTSYSNVFTAKHFARLIAILIFTCSWRSFPRSKSAIETRTMTPKKKTPNLGCL